MSRASFAFVGMPDGSADSIGPFNRGVLAGRKDGRRVVLDEPLMTRAGQQAWRCVGSDSD